MSGVSRIVCPVDLSESTRSSVAHAAALASIHDAELHLLYIPHGGGKRPSRERESRLADASISAATAVALLGPGGADVRLCLATERGNAVKAIAAYARRNSAGLIVISARYGASRRWRRASAVARRVAQAAWCPVMVVPQRAAAPLAARIQFTNVVCATDFTAVSAAALRAAIPLVQGRLERLTLLHVLKGPSHMVFSGGEAAQAVRDLEARMIIETQRLKELGPFRGLNSWQVKPMIATGVPNRIILRAAAETHADLIVMGTSRNGVLPELLAGSTSRAVLRSASCPVLLVAGDEERGEEDGSQRVVPFFQRKTSWGAGWGNQVSGRRPSM